MATKNCIPYVLKTFRTFASEGEAGAEELKIKEMKSRVYLKKLSTGN